tara:strand:+ start:167 stop:274 length:108 start_codon:yes stop_codon:yes gene_type:complete
MELVEKTLAMEFAEPNDKTLFAENALNHENQDAMQ